MIDRYDAPDGMIAVRGEKHGCCDGCAFYDIKTRRTCADTNGCMKNNDADVIFKTRAEFEAMLKQEVAQFYGVEKDDLLILVTHKDKPS